MEKPASVVDDDSAYLARARPHVTMAEAFAAGEKRYAGSGFYDDWKEHHQGGTTGYAGREVFAQPGTEYALAAGMAVAWNPTVPGAKSEDTFLIQEGGGEQLTRTENSPWPMIVGATPREGILVVE